MIEVTWSPTWGVIADLRRAVAELDDLPECMSFLEWSGPDGSGWRPRCYAEQCGGRARPWNGALSLDWAAVVTEARAHAAQHGSVEFGPAVDL